MRVVNYLLNDLNVTEDDLAIRFKYHGNRYKIPMSHPLWWIMSIVSAGLVALGIWSFMVVGLLII